MLGYFNPDGTIHSIATGVVAVDDDGSVPIPDALRNVPLNQLRLIAGVVTEVDPPPVVAPVVRPSPREWLERLPKPKQAAIFQAAVGNADLLGWLFKASGTSTGIDVTAEETIEGVGALVAAGVLTLDDQTILLTL